jgi:hypothetical protein
VAEEEGNYRRAQVEALQARTATLTAQVEALTAESSYEFMPSVVSAHEAEMLVLRKRLDEVEGALLEREEGAAVEWRGHSAGEANQALLVKVEQLEEANRRMEAALLEVGGDESGEGGLAIGRSPPQAVQELRVMLMEKEQEVGELQSRLALAGGHADGALRDATTSAAEQRYELAAALAALRQKEASLSVAHERLAELESAQLVASSKRGSASERSPQGRKMSDTQQVCGYNCFGGIAGVNWEGMEK